MHFSSRNRMRLGFSIAYSVLFIAVIVSWMNRAVPPPQIQGVLLIESRELADFELINHLGDEFSNKDLLGEWHLVSYGFTACPDVCPTTLTQLTRMKQEMDSGSKPKILFYSVDHRRDTAAQLANYLPFFDADIIGLTHLDDPDNTHLAFENSLGIASSLDLMFKPDGSLDQQGYRVNHGIALLVLNPQGRLQAILKPRETSPGIYGFDPKELSRDYLAIRAFNG
ncbi:MAG: SCO family protein [Halieaceae bacterium]|jgi:protein SCO1/2|nr:SCO family protein [Halieaceae bacterium]